MTPVRLSAILRAAPLRDPGFVAAYKAVGRLSGDVVYLEPSALADIRAKFPALLAPREYLPEESVADGTGWPEAFKQSSPPTQRPARDQWPPPARLLARFAREGDRGLGDLVQRIAAAGGGESFKVWYKRLTGRECGCGDRQADLNARFPL